MMPNGSGTELPELPIDLDTDAKQEAARFLTSSMDARPMIRGIDDEQRLADWEAVAEQLDLESRQKRALRQRREAMTGDGVDADQAFTAASEMETAVADGGAVVEEEPEEDDGQELAPHQEWMEYQDEAEFESEKNDQRRTVQDLITTVDGAEEALDKQFAKDVVPRHTVELLEERLEVLDG